MTGHVVELLHGGGYTPILAHYEPYSLTPKLSVPSYRLLQRKVGERLGESFGKCATHAIGAWLPELEFTHYMASAPWKGLLESCDQFISVSGNVLAATPFLQAGRPYLSWVATDWSGDRTERAAQFPWPRKIIDQLIAAPVIRRLERQALASGTILALSEHTRQVLNRIAGSGQVNRVMPMPVDTTLFVPQESAIIRGRIGFTGRINDPRKNIPLLLRSFAKVLTRVSEATLVMVGDTPSDCIRNTVKSLGIEGHVEFWHRMPREQLVGVLQTLDLFVICSHQEGLCISALEAMACGCPVVSTRCGGPQEFVLDDETGYLVNADANEIANIIEEIIADRAKRRRLGLNARSIVDREYDRDKSAEIFWSAFEHAFRL